MLAGRRPRSSPHIRAIIRQRAVQVSFDTEMAFDKEWLKKALAKELGWDLGTLDGIVEAIKAANGQSEVDEIVQDYLGGSLAVKRFVEQYLAAGRGANKSARPVGAPCQRLYSSARLLCTVILKVCQQYVLQLECVLVLRPLAYLIRTKGLPRGRLRVSARRAASL